VPMPSPSESSAPPLPSGTGGPPAAPPHPCMRGWQGLLPPPVLRRSKRSRRTATERDDGGGGGGCRGGCRGRGVAGAAQQGRSGSLS
jgi:hypothetical protein